MDGMVVMTEELEKKEQTIEELEQRITELEEALHLEQENAQALQSVIVRLSAKLTGVIQ